MTQDFFPMNPGTDSPAIDAFARQRVSQPQNLFDSSQTYDAELLKWEHSTAGSGSATHVPAESMTRLRVTEASGDKAIRQTRAYFPYRPGKSQLILMTGVFGSPATDIRRRIGYFDANDGIFFEQTSAGMFIVQRSSTTGSPVDTRVAQSAWNLNTMEGTRTVDWTKAQIFAIDLEWLGVGRVRVGLVLDGIPVYLHEFKNANEYLNDSGDPGVYMHTATLPCRYEIETTGAGATAGNYDLITICSSVTSEGAEPTTGGLVHSIGNGTTLQSVTTRRNVLTIRPKTQFNSRTNRIYITPASVDLYVDGTNDVYYEIVRGGTLGGSPSYSSAGSNSAVEYDVAGTTVTGGDVIASGYAVGGGVNSAVSTSRSAADTGVLQLPLTLDIAGTAQTTLSLVATSISGSTASVGGTFTWTEVR